MMYELRISVPLETDKEEAIYKSKLLRKHFNGPDSRDIEEKYDIDQVYYNLYDENGGEIDFDS